MRSTELYELDFSYTSLGEIQTSYQRALRQYMYKTRHTKKHLSQATVKQLLGDLNNPVECLNGSISTPAPTSRRKKRSALRRVKRFLPTTTDDPGYPGPPVPTSTVDPNSLGPTALTSTVDPNNLGPLVPTSTVDPNSPGPPVPTSTIDPNNLGPPVPTSTIDPNNLGPPVPTSTIDPNNLGPAVPTTTADPNNLGPAAPTTTADPNNLGPAAPTTTAAQGFGGPTANAFPAYATTDDPNNPNVFPAYTPAVDPNNPNVYPAYTPAVDPYNPHVFPTDPGSFDPSGVGVGVGGSGEGFDSFYETDYSQFENDGPYGEGSGEFGFGFDGGYFPDYGQLDYGYAEEQLQEYGIGGEFGSGWTSVDLAEDLSSFNFLDNVSDSDQNNFALLLKKGKLVDLTDVVELVQFSDDDFQNYGYSINESILECTNDRKNCGPRNFKLTRSRRYGNCMTFNSKYHGNATVRRTRKSGSRFGLRVTFNIHAAEYVGLLASEYGVRVSIHPPDVQPEPEDDGFVAEPGKLTSVAVRQRNIRRLPLPYDSACMSEMPEQLKPYVAQESSYTIRQCEKACLNYFLHKQCRCTDETYRSGFLQSVRKCAIFSTEDRTCRALVLARDSLPIGSTNSTACDCRPPCDEVGFQSSISTTDWPTDSYRKMKIINFIGKHKVADMFYEDAVAKANLTAQDMGFDPLGLLGWWDDHDEAPVKEEIDIATDITRNLGNISTLVYRRGRTFTTLDDDF